MPGSSTRPAHNLRRVRPRGGADASTRPVLARPPPRARPPQRAAAGGRTVEEEEEEEQVRRHQDPGHRDAEVRDGVLLDTREQREGEGERPDQHGEQDVQHAVAVPEPEVAGGEGARGHLHDEDADRDDETRERGCRADDRCEQVVAVDAEYSRCSVTPTRRWSGASITPEDRARRSHRAAAGTRGSPSGTGAS